MTRPAKSTSCPQDTEYRRSNTIENEGSDGDFDVNGDAFRREVSFVSPRSSASHAWETIRATEMKNEFVQEACFDVSGIKIGVEYAIADAGATGHFLIPEAPLDEVLTSANPLTIHMPHGGTLKSTKEGMLPIPWLPKEARKAHVVPGLAHASLVSIKVL